MKNNQGQNPGQNKQGMGHKPSPEIRDNLDSRKKEEQDDKGDDVTHNVKPQRNETSKIKSDHSR